MPRYRPRHHHQTTALWNSHDAWSRKDSVLAILNEQTEAVAEYSETLARRLIEKITVYDEKLVVEFKSGLMVEVEA